MHSLFMLKLKLRTKYSHLLLKLTDYPWIYKYAGKLLLVTGVTCGYLLGYSVIALLCLIAGNSHFEWLTTIITSILALIFCFINRVIYDLY